MTRWMHPPELPDTERRRERERFDPVVEGNRHGLSRDAALAIWATVLAGATDDAGRRDLERARRQFHELAAIVAARRGRLGPDVGRTTRAAGDADAPGHWGMDSWDIRELGARGPGRDTLVAADARRRDRISTSAETMPASPATARPPADTRHRSRAAGDHEVDAAVPSARMPSSARRAPWPAALDLRAWTPARRDLRRPASGTGSQREAVELSLLHADRATQVREAARMYRAGELAAALGRGEPGLVDAVAAALQDGAILAPHPVDELRGHVRGLAAELTGAGVRLGRAAARWLEATPAAAMAPRALAVADGWTGGAARAWTERTRSWTGGIARRAMAFSERAAAPAAEDALATLSAAGGEPLPAALRARMEALFGHRFAHVRIHTDGAAAQAAGTAGARAVTLGSHIYFGGGQFAPGSEAGDRLLLHELTHVVQHDQGRLSDPASGRVELSSPSDPAEQEARAMERRVAEVRSTAGEAAAPTTARAPEEQHAQRGAAPAGHASAAAAAPRASGATTVRLPDEAAAPSGPASDAPRTGRRASPDVLGWIGDRAHDAANWVGDRVDDIENWAEDKIMGLVAKVAPGLATLIQEGPGGLIKNAIEPAVSSWVGSLTGGINIGQIAGQLKGSFTAAFAVLQGARAGDPKCCETLVSGINAIREIASAFANNPVFNAIKGVFDKVSDVVGTIAKLVAGPVFDVLKTIVGGAWDAIKGVASTIQGWFNAVKNVASKAFDWVAKKLGFSSATGEGGLLDWLKQKAIEIWDKIKATLQPVIGPLKVVAGVLLMFTGLPEIYAIIKYGPQIVEAVQWLWTNRNNPDAVKQNPKLLGGSILPKILGVGQSFVDTVKKGVAWLVDKTTAFASGALNLLGAITGVPLLSMAKGFVQGMVDGIKGVQDWATGAFTSAQTWLEGLFHKVADFIKPYAEVLCSVATAIVNPAGIPLILAGWAWRWLPDCIKPPLIDLLLDAVISFLGHMPALPMLGPLWPLLKAGVIGFLGALRARDPETKIKVSNKLAKIISGASPMFLLGFVKGLLKGVWDGIKMPFEAIWMVAKGIEKAGDFFTALGTEADGKAKPAAPAAKPGAPNGHPPAPLPRAQALPGVPGVIQPGQASSVVGGIVAQLNAQKPPRPVGPAPATAPGAQPAGQTNQYRELGQEAHRMAGELAGPATTVKTGFWSAVQELFSSGKGMSLDDLIAKLGKVWSAAKSAVASLGGKIANMICDFLVKDEAEEEIGDTIGYMVGMIAFQALLDYLSAGTWTGAMGVLSAIAKFLNWPMEFLGEAMKVLKQLGGFILDGLKSLGSMIAEAGAGALREVTGAFREIATKLGEFAEEIMAKFRGEAGAVEKDAASTLEKDAANTVEKDAASTAEKDGASLAEKEALKAEELAEAIEISKGIATAEDAGHVPGPVIALSLEALKARYTWIKAYEAVPNAAGFEIFLIASKFTIIQARARINKLPADVQARFAAFDDATLIKLAELDDAALIKLAKLDDATLAKLATFDKSVLVKLGTLDEVTLAKLAKLDEPALAKLAGLNNPTLTKLAQFDDATLAKLVGFDRPSLAKLAKLDEPVLAKLFKLDEGALTKLTKLDDAALSRLAKLDDAMLAKILKLDDTALAKVATLDDAALAKLDDAALADLGKAHVHTGGVEANPQSPYAGKWDGSGVHDWEELQAICKRDGYTIKSVIEDPATGVRRVEIERTGLDAKGNPVTGTIKKTIYPKGLTPEEIDAAGSKAFDAALKNEPGSKLDPFDPAKLKKDGSPADGFFEATVQAGSPPRNVKIQGWYTETADGTKVVTSHAPAYDKSWPAVDPKDY